MKHLLAIFSVLLLTTTSWASTNKEAEILNKLIPADQDTAVWATNCVLSMKGKVFIKRNGTFKAKLKAYSSSNCKEGTDYITLSRTGTYKYQEAVYATYGQDDYSYQYIKDPEQLALTMSPIKIHSQGALGPLAEQLLAMYSGCFGDQTNEIKNKACLKSGLAKTKSRVRIESMYFITPVKMIADFNIPVELSLVK